MRMVPQRQNLTVSSSNARNQCLLQTRRKQVQLSPRLHMLRAAAVYIPLLSVESLLPPIMPTKGEMEGVLLELRNASCFEEYFGN